MTLLLGRCHPLYVRERKAGGFARNAQQREYPTWRSHFAVGVHRAPSTRRICICKLSPSNSGVQQDHNHVPHEDLRSIGLYHASTASRPGLVTRCFAVGLLVALILTTPRSARAQNANTEVTTIRPDGDAKAPGSGPMSMVKSIVTYPFKTMDDMLFPTYDIVPPRPKESLPPLAVKPVTSQVVETCPEAALPYQDPPISSTGAAPEDRLDRELHQQEIDKMYVLSSVELSTMPYVLGQPWHPAQGSRNAPSLAPSSTPSPPLSIFSSDVPAVELDIAGARAVAQSVGTALKALMEGTVNHLVDWSKAAEATIRGNFPSASAADPTVLVGAVDDMLQDWSLMSDQVLCEPTGGQPIEDHLGPGQAEGPSAAAPAGDQLLQIYLVAMTAWTLSVFLAAAAWKVTTLVRGRGGPPSPSRAAVPGHLHLPKLESPLWLSVYTGMFHPIGPWGLCPSPSPPWLASPSTNSPVKSGGSPGQGDTTERAVSTKTAQVNDNSTRQDDISGHSASPPGQGLGVSKSFYPAVCGRPLLVHHLPSDILAPLVDVGHDHLPSQGAGATSEAKEVKQRQIGHVSGAAAGTSEGRSAAAVSESSGNRGGLFWPDVCGQPVLVHHGPVDTLGPYMLVNDDHLASKSQGEVVGGQEEGEQQEKELEEKVGERQPNNFFQPVCGQPVVVEFHTIESMMLPLSNISSHLSDEEVERQPGDCVIVTDEVQDGAPGRRVSVAAGPGGVAAGHPEPPAVMQGDAGGMQAMLAEKSGWDDMYMTIEGGDASDTDKVSEIAEDVLTVEDAVRIGKVTEPGYRTVTSTLLDVVMDPNSETMDGGKSPDERTGVRQVGESFENEEQWEELYWSGEARAEASSTKPGAAVELAPTAEDKRAEEAKGDTVGGGIDRYVWDLDLIHGDNVERYAPIVKVMQWPPARGTGGDAELMVMQWPPARGTGGDAELMVSGIAKEKSEAPVEDKKDVSVEEFDKESSPPGLGVEWKGSDSASLELQAVGDNSSQWELLEAPLSTPLGVEEPRPPALLLRVLTDLEASSPSLPLPAEAVPSLSWSGLRPESVPSVDKAQGKSKPPEGQEPPACCPTMKPQTIQVPVEDAPDSDGVVPVRRSPRPLSRGSTASLFWPPPLGQSQRRRIPIKDEGPGDLGVRVVRRQPGPRGRPRS